MKITNYRSSRLSVEVPISLPESLEEAVELLGEDLVFQYVERSLLVVFGASLHGKVIDPTISYELAGVERVPGNPWFIRPRFEPTEES